MWVRIEAARLNLDARPESEHSALECPDQAKPDPSRWRSLHRRPVVYISPTGWSEWYSDYKTTTRLLLLDAYIHRYSHCPDLRVCL